MSILDDAIREHLELKRAHGADEGELQRLEDEAFGPPQRPDEIDPFAEAPTEFLLSPEETAAAVPEVGDEAARSGRRPNITDLQEGPPTEVPGSPEAPPADEAPAPADPPPAPEVEARGPKVEGRAPAEVEEPAEAPPEQPPLETRGPDAEVAGHPPPEAAPEEESSEFDFFNEQRLSDELDQALEAPLPPTDEHIAMPRYEDAPAQGGIFDFESEGEAYEERPAEEAPRPASEPPSEEAERDSFEPPSEEAPRAAAEPPSEEAEYDYDPETGHEDVLEDTPRFLEDQPEDDDLWFEQKPPKDFDLD